VLPPHEAKAREELRKMEMHIYTLEDEVQRLRSEVSDFVTLKQIINGVGPE
jgi:hypothetical protein